MASHRRTKTGSMSDSEGFMSPVPGRLARWRAAVSDPDALRSWSVVANDGIIATAGILEGFAGAGASHATLVTAATSATNAGMLGVRGSERAEAAAARGGQL